MARAPRISVLMPVWNAATTVDEAVQSIRAQTIPNWELIAVDDGSTDGTLARLQAIAAEDERIRVIDGPHRGIVAALQQAATLAEGEFLARMDADDWADPTRLQKQLAGLGPDTRIALCGTHVTSEPGTLGPGRQRYQDWLNALVDPFDLTRAIFVECPIAHPTFFLRRETFEAVGGYQDHGWAEDYDLVLRLHAEGYAITNVPEPLLRWRNRTGRHSMTDERYSPEAFRRAKRHYLAQTYLEGNRSFVQWGAGEVGKEWLREWETPPLAVVDINPRKIGKTIHGVPVMAPGDLLPPGGPIILVAVGAPGARDDIRAWLNPKGYYEIRDYLFIA